MRDKSTIKHKSNTTSVTQLRVTAENRTWPNAAEHIHRDWCIISSFYHLHCEEEPLTLGRSFCGVGAGLVSVLVQSALS